MNNYCITNIKIIEQLQQQKRQRNFNNKDGWRSATTLKSNCSGSSLEITEKVEIDNLEYGTLTSFRIATIGFDETNYSSEIIKFESN